MNNMGNTRWKEGARKIDLQVCPATPADLPQVAELFLFSFSETINHLYGVNIPRKEKLQEALQDFFTFLHKEEPEAFWIAREKKNADQGLAGYLVVSPDLVFLWRRAFLGGYLFLWIAKLFTGAYGLNLRALGHVLINKMAFWRTSRFQPCRAQILSLAVAEHCRGRGIGRALLQKGLTYLRRRSRYQIKLEVRPWNKPALNLYRSFGFSRVGITHDTQGEWLVMVAATANAGAEQGVKNSSGK